MPMLLVYIIMEKEFCQAIARILLFNRVCSSPLMQHLGYLCKVVFIVGKHFLNFMSLYSLHVPSGMMLNCCIDEDD